MKYPYFPIISPYYPHISLVSLSYERSDDIELEIVGVDCSNGRKLKKIAYKAVDEINQEIFITEIKKDNKKYPITNFPGLIINGKIISEGKVLTSREIKKILLSS